MVNGKVPVSGRSNSESIPPRKSNSSNSRSSGDKIRGELEDHEFMVKLYTPSYNNFSQQRNVTSGKLIAEVPKYIC